MPVIIGLLGRKRSGKDTFAARLVEAHGYKRFAFADALKDAALALDPIVYAQNVDGYGEMDYARLSDVVESVGWEDAKELAEVRRTLQNMGVGVRNLDPDFWLRVVMDKVRAADGPAVITDVRFPNEHAAVTAAGGYTVRILRPGNDTSDTHISETALDNHRVDDEILNGGTVANLHQRADNLADGVAWTELERVADHGAHQY